MSEEYYTGNFKKDGLEGPNRGWIVGTFMEDSPRKCQEVEIKYWEFKLGESPEHGIKVSDIVECTFILKGKTKCIIGNDNLELREGDYVVIKPGTPNNLVSCILEDVAGLTIKAPSDPSAKRLVQI